MSKPSQILNVKFIGMCHLTFSRIVNGLSALVAYRGGSSVAPHARGILIGQFRQEEIGSFRHLHELSSSRQQTLVGYLSHYHLKPSRTSYASLPVGRHDIPTDFFTVFYEKLFALTFPEIQR
ncbi:hypothetical protein UPYG_G00059650 [Umbra pygmaea]|uniref:Uncharacterized protein n=1 Tax=Umbra pygmaea TaxID=75934 RepID=A0ABD0XCT7_UMBPY